MEEMRDLKGEGVILSREKDGRRNVGGGMWEKEKLCEKEEKGG